MTKHKGQTLIELASFGSILILCLALFIEYGMQANYEQNLQMQAFRRAMKAAYYKTGPAASVSLGITKDKANPDPRDQWGFASRKPIAAAAAVTWDSNVSSEYIEDYSEVPRNSDLPRSIIEINDTLGLKDADFSDSDINNIGSKQGAFTTANYDLRPCTGSILVVLENTPEDRLKYRREYREIPVSCSAVLVSDRRSKEESPGKKYAFIKIDELPQIVETADVNGDGELDTIIAVEGTKPCDKDGYCGNVRAFRFIDFQKGEIDAEKTVILPWEVNKDKANIKTQQGLIADYTVTQTNNNSLVKTENPITLDTATALRGNQRVIHTIRFNDGTTRNYTTTFRPKSTIGNWPAVSK